MWKGVHVSSAGSGRIIKHIKWIYIGTLCPDTSDWKDAAVPLYNFKIVRREKKEPGLL